jgi:hypothetical protein
MTTVQLPVQLWCDHRATGGAGHPLIPPTPGRLARLHACALSRLAAGLLPLAPTDDHTR